MYSKKAKILTCILTAFSLNIFNVLFITFGATHRIDIAESIANDIEVATTSANTNRVEIDIVNESPGWFVYNSFNLLKYSSFDDGSFAYMKYDGAHITKIEDRDITECNVLPFGTTNERLVTKNIYETKIISGSSDFSYLLPDSNGKPTNYCAVSQTVCDRLGISCDDAINKTIVLNGGITTLTITSVLDDKCLLSDFGECSFVLSNFMNFSPKISGETFVSKMQKGKYASNLTTVGALINLFYFNVKNSGGHISINLPGNEWIVNEIELYNAPYIKNQQYSILLFVFFALSSASGFILSLLLKHNPNLFGKFKDIYIHIFTAFCFLSVSTIFSLLLNHHKINGLAINTFSSSCIVGELAILIGWLIGVVLYSLFFRYSKKNNRMIKSDDHFEIHI